MEHPAYTLSALTTVGGIIGYMRKKSIPSLVAGLAFGSVYAISGYLLHMNRDYGLELALGTSVALAASGIFRGALSVPLKPVPAILALCGTTGTVYYFRKYKEFYP
ncbi:Uncharacterized protein RNJ44_01560 [Nakaseomyces bracarensis]|uniref:TMEM14 protein n=1 Tax=Nakaseomyces bracarensis TaxID=273131 RepID=A0ABR4NQ27_9SACH